MFQQDEKKLGGFVKNVRRILSVAAVITLAVSTLVPCSSAFADRLSEMISPITNPVNFEDPRINSELRPFFMHHEIHDKFVTQGGDVQLYALQARLKLDDDWAFIATKDGFIDFNPKAVLPKETGFANVTVGGKYAFYQDPEAGEIATAGLRYEIPMGNTDVLMGRGDGFFNPFFSGAMALGDFNGDDILDIVAADKGDNTVSVLLGDGAGGFGAASKYSTRLCRVMFS